MSTTLLHIISHTYPLIGLLEIMGVFYHRLSEFENGPMKRLPPESGLYTKQSCKYVALGWDLQYSDCSILHTYWMNLRRCINTKLTM